MSEAPHRNVIRVIDAGRELGIDVLPRHFPQGAKTAQDAADAIGVDVGQIVKSLIFGVASDADELELVLATSAVGTNSTRSCWRPLPVQKSASESMPMPFERALATRLAACLPLVTQLNCACSSTPTSSSTTRCGLLLEPGMTSSLSSRTSLFERVAEKSPTSANSYAWGQAPFATLSKRPLSTACRSAANAGSSARRTRPRRAVARTEPALPNP
jgi:hypothetical protein